MFKYIFAFLPVLTLVLGWQLGANSAELQVEQAIKQIETSLNGSNQPSSVTNPEEEVDLALFWTVWRKVLQEYNEPTELDAKEMIHGAIGGMVRSIGDPYTMFMNPSENTEFRDSLQGNLQGIGAELTFKEELLTVVAPLKGSPAARAGLLPNDVILEVDGESTEGQSLDELVHKIRGPKGTKVTLTIARADSNSLREVEIIREEITVPSTEYEIKELDGKNIGYLAINQFGDHTTQEVRAGLESFANKNLAGIVIDMRYNGGGYLDKSIDIVSMLVGEGKVVTVDRRGEDPDTRFVNGRPIDTTTPIVVLINEGSASASEIVAGALRDNNRAVLMGQTSFGKGSIQEVFALPGGSSVRITIAKWLTPNGENVSEVGIEPQYLVERTQEDWEAQRDPQLDAAMEYLANGVEPVAEESNEEIDE